MTATLTRQSPVTVAQPARRTVPRPAPRTCGAVLAAVCVVVGGWVGLTGLAPPARVVLVAFGLAIVGWTMTDIDDTFVSLAAAGSLVLAGGVAADTLFASMGDSTVWLLLASFVVAAAVSASGLSQRLVGKVAARARNVGQLFWLLTAVVLGTSFVVPATSGRAALMVPVFAALAGPIGDRRVTRALALLFPTMILLSAVASLLGAGAHLVAAELIASLGGERIGFNRWLLLGLPFAVCSCGLSCSVILRLFLTRDERGRELPAGLRDDARPLSPAERRVVAVVVALVALWMTESLHGVDATVVALAGALIVTAPGTGVISFAEGVRNVQWSLLLFLAATLVLGEALVSSGAAGWLAETAFSQAGSGSSPLLVVTIVAVVSLLAHLVITSRTARSSVLVPLVVLLAGSMHLNPTALAFLSTAAAGFCQTLAVSAKPVAMFSRFDSLPTGQPYTSRDLLRLAAVLGPLHLVLLVTFAFTVWPALGLNLAG